MAWFGLLVWRTSPNARNPLSQAEKDRDCPLLVVLRKPRVLGSFVLWEMREGVQHGAAPHPSRLWATDCEAPFMLCVLEKVSGWCRVFLETLKGEQTEIC